MLNFQTVLKMTCAAMCLSIAASVFAEPAPVYDADSMENPDQAQYLPPPPPPGQEGGSAFIPVQSPVSSVRDQPQLNMDQRIQRVEQQVSNMQNSDAATRVDSLQSQVQALRGQIEQLTHQLEQLQSQQKTMYTDLDKRVAQAKPAALDAEQAGTKIARAGKPVNPVDDNTIVADNPPEDDLPVAKPDLAKTDNETSKPVVIKTSRKQTTTSESKAQPDVAEEQQIYQTAYNFIKAKRYNDAVTALQGMLKKYPGGQFASNAHYWLGELYGLMGKNDQALSEFRLVVEMYPESPRVSDAQLKVGLLLASQLKWPEAKSALRNVINHYPGSASARLAAEQLKQIKIAGH